VRSAAAKPSRGEPEPLRDSLARVLVPRCSGPRDENQRTGGPPCEPGESNSGDGATVLNLPFPVSTNRLA